MNKYILNIWTYDVVCRGGYDTHGSIRTYVHSFINDIVGLMHMKYHIQDYNHMVVKYGSYIQTIHISTAQAYTEICGLSILHGLISGGMNYKSI